MKNFWIRLLMAPVMAFALTGCDVDVNDEGKLPDVDVDATPGEAPDVDVTPPDVNVHSEKEKVTVPDVDVDVNSKEREINVPKIDVDIPDENENG